MKLKLFIITLISLVFVYSCGNVKERKKEIPGGTAENVTTYTDPIEEVGEEEFNNYSADSLENTSNVTMPEEEYSLLNDSTDEVENAISEETEEVVSSVTSNTTGNTSTVITGSQTTTTVTSTTAAAKGDYKRFLIVGGSFKSLAKAQSLDKQFKKEGVKSYISGQVNGYHRVIVGKYDVKTAALKDLTKFRRTYTKMRFWLLGER